MAVIEKNNYKNYLQFNSEPVFFQYAVNCERTERFTSFNSDNKVTGGGQNSDRMYSNM